MGNIESRSELVNHVEQLSPAERFARLSPWQIAQNTMLFALEKTQDPVNPDKKTTSLARFEDGGAQFAISLQARGNHPKEIFLKGARFAEGEEEQSFGYVLTKKGTKREGADGFIDAAERERLVILMGRANLLLTIPNSHL